MKKKQLKQTIISKAQTLLDRLNYIEYNDVRDMVENNGVFSTTSHITITEHIDDHVLDEIDKSFAIPFDNVGYLVFHKSDVTGIPLKCSIQEDLHFKFCGNLKHLDCKNIELLSDFISILSFNACSNLTHVNNIVSSSMLKILFYDCAIQNIDLLNEHQEVVQLRIANSSFNDLSCIRNCIYGLVQLSETCITNFSPHNATEIQRCEFDCNYITSFTNIDDFQVTTRFRLSNIDDHCNNNINILNNKCDTIIIDPDSTISSIDVDAMKAIIRKYLRVKNRSNYIMYCAVELLDLNYNMAAEL